LKEVADPGNYYCRKGFYALNVQAICDMSKQFLWCYPSNKGSAHDSAAFGGSRLYDLLKEKSNDLYNRGVFIVGDSAYGLTSFLLTPYETEEMRDDPLHAKDSFNYHLSSCRIYIECAFGELVMRWGIF
jgi:DDE superfamily endonuclease